IVRQHVRLTPCPGANDRQPKCAALLVMAGDPLTIWRPRRATFRCAVRAEPEWLAAALRRDPDRIRRRHTLCIPDGVGHTAVTGCHGGDQCHVRVRETRGRLRPGKSPGADDGAIPVIGLTMNTQLFLTVCW